MSPNKPQANDENLWRIFTIPENENTTLGKIEKHISENLNGFLKTHIVASDRSAADLERDFSESTIPEDPIFVSEQADFLLQKVVAQSVHVSSPSFIGHMTSALPYFMLPLAKIMIALNQNLVKIETSKAFTPLERQVIAMLHRLIFQMDDEFYQTKTHNPGLALGAMCSDGTIANITCLWVALCKLFPETNSFAGIAQEGLFAAMNEHQFKGIKVLVSERGHYSISKAANILGIGKRNVLRVRTDSHNKISIDDLRSKIASCQKQGFAIAAVVGIAGTTETGNVDPLSEMARICAEHQIHFHVDAAWGGPTLFSTTHKSLLDGIERADSVTFDAHKQLYVPVGAGLALFKDEKDLGYISHHADYIIREGSRDLGKMTLEGSRPGMAMLIHSGLRIIGRRGYEILIDKGIEKARIFAKLIEEQPDFELISEPELNLLTYRYVPKAIRDRLEEMSPDKACATNVKLNSLNTDIQKNQREAGKNFVSRTKLTPKKYGEMEIAVLRSVLANPLTTSKILCDVIDEQRRLGESLQGKYFR